MDEKDKAVDGAEKAVTQVDVDTTVDYEARVVELEAERAKLIEERENYKIGMLKAKADNKEDFEEGEDERIERITKKTIADSQLANIARELAEINRKALKENKELKLAQMNKKEPGAAVGTHSESTPVRDTIVTQDQLNAFKTRGWTEKDIERYKKNLVKYSGR